jgi:hypothetical protein
MGFCSLKLIFLISDDRITLAEQSTVPQSTMHLIWRHLSYFAAQGPRGQGQSLKLLIFGFWVLKFIGLWELMFFRLLELIFFGLWELKFFGLWELVFFGFWELIFFWALGWTQGGPRELGTQMARGPKGPNTKPT